MNNINFKLTDNNPNAKMAFMLQWMLGVIIIVSIISTIFEIDLLNRIYYQEIFTIEEAEFNDTRQFVIVLIQFLFFIVSEIYLIRWFYYSYLNIHSFENLNLEYKPKMAIWGFFIPFLNLVRPFQIAKEIFSSNKILIVKKDESFLFENKKYIINLWWIMLLGSNVFAIVSSKLGLNTENIEQTIVYSKFLIISELIDILSVIMTMVFIKFMNKYETTVYNLYKDTNPYKENDNIESDKPTEE